MMMIIFLNIIIEKTVLTIILTIKILFTINSLEKMMMMMIIIIIIIVIIMITSLRIPFGCL